MGSSAQLLGVVFSNQQLNTGGGMCLFFQEICEQL